MKILCLYKNPCALPLFDWLERQGHTVIRKQERLDADWCRAQGFDLTVSYTYPYILSAKILDALGNNAVNLHNSYLPWNRGADPNIWSVLEGTPRGVSLHYMSAELDKGDIIAQRLVRFAEEQTLKSSYQALDMAARQLFIDAFAYYPFWNGMRKQAVGAGSYHSVKDGAQFRQSLTTYDIMETAFRQAYLSALAASQNQQ